MIPYYLYDFGKEKERFFVPETQNYFLTLYLSIIIFFCYEWKIIIT